MKKSVTLVMMLLFSIAMTSAACDLESTLLNQDPYPAVPGDYVKLVFQLDGLDSPECNDITFNLLSDYPIEFDPGKNGLRLFKKLDYIKDYESSILIPYEVRVNKDALDGTIPIDVAIQSKGDAPVVKTFELEIEDVRTKFEVYVKDYSYDTNDITLEVLNTGESSIEALTLEIPKQNTIDIKGPNRMVVGDLDSNEYTTADFEAIPQDGKFKISLTYSDTINTRRTIEKTVTFDSSYFINRKADQKTTGTTTYILYAVIVLLLAWWVVKKFTKKKKK